MLLRYLLLGLIAAGSASFPVKHRAVPARRNRTRHASYSSHTSHPSHLLPDTLPARDRIDRLIQRQERAGQQVALAVVSLAGDTLIDSWHAIDPMIPASNLKILVTAAGWQQWDSSLVTAIRRKLGRRAWLHTTPASQPSHTSPRRTGQKGPNRQPPATSHQPPADSLNLTFPENDTVSGLPGYDLLCRIGKLSDNNVANALMDCLVERQGHTSHLSHSSYSPTPDNRLQVLEDYLRQNRIWSGGLNCEDGSGRSPRDRTTALTLVQTLAWFWHGGGHDPNRLDSGSCPQTRDAFVRCLSVAGSDGTLRRHDMALGPRVRAKTGSISGVYSLSGYLALPDDTLAFSIILNRSYNKKSAFDFFADVLGTL
jgi:D-alanyl-D-alanine carboxypeptidase